MKHLAYRGHGAYNQRSNCFGRHSNRCLEPRKNLLYASFCSVFHEIYGIPQLFGVHREAVFTTVHFFSLTAVIELTAWDKIRNGIPTLFQLGIKKPILTVDFFWFSMHKYGFDFQFGETRYSTETKDIPCSVTIFLEKYLYISKNFTNFV